MASKHMRVPNQVWHLVQLTIEASNLLWTVDNVLTHSAMEQEIYAVLTAYIQHHYAKKSQGVVSE